MILSIFLTVGFYTAVSVCSELVIFSKTQTSILAKYETYSDVLMIHLKVPQDTIFASFKFVAEETERMSMIQFGCKPRQISLYMKHGAPPVINPDGSPFPKLFKNVTRNEQYELEFQSDKKPLYINITSPDPGSYYVATFLSYSDPKYNQIKQQGLAPSCYATVESTLYGRNIENPIIVSEGDLTQTILTTGQIRYFKFYIPISLVHAIISIHNIFFFSQEDSLLMRIGSMKPSSEKYFEKEEIIYSNSSSATLMFWTKPEEWHYLEFQLRNKTIAETSSNFTFRLKYFTNILSQEHTNYQYLENKTLYNNSYSKSFHNNKITDLVPYKQYDLVREASSETFTFSYELEEELNSNVAIPINMTNQHFSVFKFKVREGTDIGGTLQFILAFKSKLKTYDSSNSLEGEPENHTIIACLRKGTIDIPTWPNLCVSNGVETKAPLILNKTVGNSTVLIPYPEYGTWYATLKLFCGICEPCNCPQNCQMKYEQCLKECEDSCVISGGCEQCSMNCSESIIGDKPCEGCNCDGPCLKNPKMTCNSSVIFDIGSHPCIFGHCSKNGKCVFMVSDGVVFSTCICVNKYRGWDCSDSSQATPYYMVVIELLFLVLSNLLFLPAVYVAFKRKYYIESLTYFAMCFFSTFYHACDAGENIISFCIIRWEALQFGDFFCALLSIWVTLIAMADLPQLSTSVAHMGGSIILAVCTTINKTALWIFASPFVTGLIIVAVSWYFKYRKVRQRFGNKRYFMVNVPLATFLVGIGLVLYAFLQTEDNYKYLHSIWHMLMAVALVVVLPKSNTFMPEVLL